MPSPSTPVFSYKYILAVRALRTLVNRRVDENEGEKIEILAILKIYISIKNKSTLL